MTCASAVGPGDADGGNVTPRGGSSAGRVCPWAAARVGRTRAGVAALRAAAAASAAAAAEIRDAPAAASGSRHTNGGGRPHWARRLIFDSDSEGEARASSVSAAAGSFSYGHVGHGAAAYASTPSRDGMQPGQDDLREDELEQGVPDGFTSRMMARAMRALELQDRADVAAVAAAEFKQDSSASDTEVRALQGTGDLPMAPVEATAVVDDSQKDIERSIEQSIMTALSDGTFGGGGNMALPDAARWTATGFDASYGATAAGQAAAVAAWTEAAQAASALSTSMAPLSIGQP